MKISIIGAGNIGGLTAMRLAESGFVEIVLVDLVKDLSQGKAFDLEDAREILKYNYNIQGTGDIKKIENSDIVIVTAGLTRKPGMSREDLLTKNAQILKEICVNIKELARDSVVIIVTNPVDLMTYLALKITGFKNSKIIGMGASLDASRFANLISQELNIPVTEVEAIVIGAHGEGMLPLSRFTNIKGVPLTKFMDNATIDALIKKTVTRGAEIVSLLGSTSAYFAPSAAITEIVKVILKDEKRILGVSAYLNGEYGIKDICIGAPCRIGREGIEKIIELELDNKEKEIFLKSAESIRRLTPQLIN
ncbi:MAG: malate dehydrogenase [Candidatus Omnitrophica bacterium]|nr:malate dehydrogenase [Candidatus Omnitrophota bacterium]